MKTKALNIDSVTGLNTPAKVPNVRVLSTPRLPNSTYPSPSVRGVLPILNMLPSLRNTFLLLINGAFSLVILTCTGSAFVEPISGAIILQVFFKDNKPELTIHIIVHRRHIVIRLRQLYKSN